MMKMINAAYEVLKDFSGDIPSDSKDGQNGSACCENYSEAVSEALNKIISLDGLEIEVCGAWVWVSGNTKAHKEILKEAGFKYASKKNAGISALKIGEAQAVALILWMIYVINTTAPNLMRVKDFILIKSVRKGA